jgi:hypothetical protein
VSPRGGAGELFFVKARCCDDFDNIIEENVGRRYIVPGWMI